MSARPGFRNDRGESRIEHLRVPPQSVEAEQAVLGGIMLIGHYPNDAYDAVADLLTQESFYRRDHQLIWKAIQHLNQKKRPTDAVTLGDWFESQGLADQVAGGAYLVELASTTPSAANIRAYAEIVVDKALRRNIIEYGTDVVNAGFEQEGRDTIEIIGRIQSDAGRLLAAQPCELEPIAPVMARVFDRLQDRYANGGGAAVVGVSTGLTEFDDFVGGLQPTDLVILAARPSMGKTTLAQNIGEAFGIKHKKRVALFSFEMQPEQLGDRLLSSVGDIEAARIKRGDLDDADWANVTRAIRLIRGAEIFVTKPKSARGEQVCAQIRRLHAQSDLGLVVIDYLQLMETSGDNRAQGFGDITRMLKLLAGELGITIIVLSQLNRDVEKRPDKRPQMSDLRESGAIEQDADLIVFIYRDDYYYPTTSRYPGTAELIIGKQRNGPRGMVRVAFRGDRYRFEDLPFDWEPKPKDSGDGDSKASKRSRRKGGSVGADAAAGDA